MRILSLIIACGLFVWFLMPAMAPVSPEDRRQARQAMYNAANRLESSPCDPKLRVALHNAVAAFLATRQYSDPPVSEEEDDIIRAAGLGILQPGHGRFACDSSG
ncbi:MAG TPA: hypothetical protein VF502_17600 [Stellaceae bacterium]